jgi:hypothetical protein
VKKSKRHMPPPAAAEPKVQEKQIEHEKSIASTLKPTAGAKIIDQMENGKPLIVKKWEDIYNTAFAKAGEKLHQQKSKATA